MPFDNTPVPLYPAVTNSPGVPPINRPSTSPFSNAASDNSNPNTFDPPPDVPHPVDFDTSAVPGSANGQWGIFDSGGNPVIQANSTIQMDLKSDFRITTAPQEQGSFASYNKVADPIMGHMKFAQGGSIQDRNACLASVQAAVGSYQGQNLQLYNIVIPEFTFQNMNLTHFDFKKEVRSMVQLLVIEIWFEEVRITGTSAFSNSNTATPSGTTPINGGQPQPQNPSSSFPSSDASNPTTYTPPPSLITNPTPPIPPAPPPLPPSPESNAAGGYTGANGDPIAPII